MKILKRKYKTRKCLCKRWKWMAHKKITYGQEKSKNKKDKKNIKAENLNTHKTFLVMYNKETTNMAKCDKDI